MLMLHSGQRRCTGCQAVAVGWEAMSSTRSLVEPWYGCTLAYTANCMCSCMFAAQVSVLQPYNDNGSQGEVVS